MIHYVLESLLTLIWLSYLWFFYSIIFLVVLSFLLRPFVTFKLFVFKNRDCVLQDFLKEGGCVLQDFQSVSCESLILKCQTCLPFMYILSRIFSTFFLSLRCIKCFGFWYQGLSFTTIKGLNLNFLNCVLKFIFSILTSPLFHNCLLYWYLSTLLVSYPLLSLIPFKEKKPFSPKFTPRSIQRLIGSVQLH